MAVTYGYFNSVNGDRRYDADDFNEMFKGIVTDGVFQHVDGGLAVSAGSGMTVSVASGRAIVLNHWVQNSAALTLSISDASSTYARIDAVMLRISLTTRSVEIYVKAGEASASPVAPEVYRSDTTYEMALAYVNVAAGATSVTVTDKRSDSAVCGWAAVAQATSGEVDQMLNAMKTGFDGVTYSSPAAMVQGSDQKLQEKIDGLAHDLNNGPGMVDNNILRGVDWTDGYYTDASGSHASEGWTLSDNITVTAGNTLYFTSEGFYYTFYNGESIVSGGAANKGALAIPSGATSVRIAKTIASKNKECVYENTIKIGYPLFGINPLFNMFVSGGVDVGDLSDANDAIPGMAYMMNTGATISHINHMPSSVPSVNKDFILITFQTNLIYPGWSFPKTLRRTQLFMSDDLQIVYKRVYQQNNWYDWEFVNDKITLDTIYNIHSGNWNSGNLTDANNASVGVIYTMSSGESGNVSNLPSSMMPGQDYLLLTTESKLNNNSRKIQILVSENLQYIYKRDYQNNTWYGWEYTDGGRTIFTVKPSGGDYTKFTDALHRAVILGHADIYIYPGTYDICSEINVETAGSGPSIGNDVRLYFYEGAEIVCNYTGGNSTVESTFSPLNAMAGDFEIHNMVLKCTNTRYCVHDERAGNAESYYHLYKNCKMYHDVRTSSWQAYQCIGGGLGQHGVIEIIGGYYDAYNTLPSRTDIAEITYHQPTGSDTTFKNKLIARDVYFKNTTIVAICAGSSQLMSDFVVSGCSCKIQPSVYFTLDDPNIHYENWEMIAWNNEIRS